MKRNNFYKNIGRIILATGLVTTVMLSSCLKDTSPGALDLSKSPALVGFQYYGFAATPISVKLLGTKTQDQAIKLTLSTPSITLGSAVTVNIAQDDADAQAYADAQSNAGTPTSLLPASQFSIGATQVTIPAGQQYATFPVTFKGAAIDFNASTWVVGLKITGANGALVASNLKVAILTLTLQSAYEGDYNDKGFVLRAGDPVLSGYYSNHDQQLATVSANSVTFTVLWAPGSAAGGIGNTTITVDPASNKVTMASADNPTAMNKPGYNNRYDPATKTFYISMTWSTPGTRETTDTLTYKGPL